MALLNLIGNLKVNLNGASNIMPGNGPMILRTTLFFFSSLTSPLALGQLHPEDIFCTGEHFTKENCEVETYPDWRHLIILNSQKFYSSSNVKGKNRNDSLVLVGKYRIVNDSVYFTEIRFAHELINVAHRDTIQYKNQPQYAWLNRKYPDVKFKIKKCEDGQVLLVTTVNDGLWYAKKQSDKDWVVHQMKVNGQWALLK
jgi:hypothetical protein